MAYQPAQQAEITAFVTTTPLGAGATFDSGVLDAAGKSQVQTEINASHDGTIDIEFCADAGGTDVVRSLSIPYVAANGYQFFAAPAFVNYIRYQFTNTAGVIQTDFYYTTKFLTTGLSPQLLTTNAFIAEAMVATLGRNLLVGQNDGGQFKNVRVDNQQHLEVNASNPKTSYDEIPVAELSPIAQLTYAYNVNTESNLITENNGGTITQANNMAILQTNTTANGQAILESKRKIPFKAGQGALVRFDCVFTAGIAQAGSRQWVGVGDADDGFLFGYDTTNFAITYRRDATGAGSAIIINQADWNVDPMDGTGPSGMTLDPTKGNVYQISYGAGFGNVSFSIESDLTGDMVLVHVIEYANKFTVPSTYNPTFPMCAEAHNGGSTTNLVTSIASMSIFTEGKNIPTGPIQSFQNRSSGLTDALDSAVFALRIAGDFPIGSGATNKVNIYLKSIGLLNDANKAAVFDLVLNPTPVTTPTWVNIDTNTSVVQTATNVLDDSINISTGKVLWSGGLAKDSGGTVDISDLGLFLRPGDILYATVNMGSGASGVDESVSLIWQEDF